MAGFKEIVTKAVIGKAKKTNTMHFSFTPDETVSTILGCWVINHNFSGVNQNGKVENVTDMGKRKLAYEIKKNKEAYYMQFDFEATPESIAELERIYRITDEVLKFIVIKK